MDATRILELVQSRSQWIGSLTICCACVLGSACLTEESGFDAGEALADSEATPSDTGEDDTVSASASATWEVVYRAEPDPSVLQDLAFLTRDNETEVVTAETMDARWRTTELAPQSARIVVEYLGKGKPKRVDEPEPPTASTIDDDELHRVDESAYVSLTGANMVTRNRFRMRIPKAYLAEFGDLTPWVDPDAKQPTTATESLAAAPPDGSAANDAPDAFATQAEPEPLPAWSNNYDSRRQIYGTNSGVGGVNRWLVDLGGCTASMVGARHIVTAAHCVTNFGAGGTQWSLDGVTATIGRNGSSNNGAITIDTNNIPPGEVAWWWTSTGWTDGTAPGVSDFAIVTLPGSFGCQSYNGQCNFAYSFTRKSTLKKKSIYSRGYPSCDAVTFNGSHRIDEPCQSNGQTPASCSNYGGAACTTPCRANHVYGQSSACGFGNFSDSGRRFWHGCDVSAGDSGAPVYYNKSGTWTLAGVHYYSDCGKSCSESCSGMTRPARATRITKNRRDTINWFITNWPNY